MSTLNRRWATDGTRVVGTAPGHKDIVYAPVGRPRTPEDVDTHRQTAVLLAEALNADGGPHLTANQRAVLDAVLAHQAVHPWPAPMSHLVEATGLVRQTVHNILDQLVDLGLGTRPPRATDGDRRPFIAHSPAGQ